MKFSDYKYERPIYEEVKKEFISMKGSMQMEPYI